MTNISDTGIAPDYETLINAANGLLNAMANEGEEGADVAGGFNRLRALVDAHLDRKADAVNAANARFEQHASVIGSHRSIVGFITTEPQPLPQETVLSGLTAEAERLGMYAGGGLSPLTACDLAYLNLQDLAAKERELYRVFKAAQAALVESGTCTHPPERRDSYRWEHDNGYGRQTMYTGVMCKLCGAKDPWSNGHFVIHSERSNEW